LSGWAAHSAPKRIKIYILLQMILVLVALICIPWMLLAKPFVQKREHNQKAAGGARLAQVNSITK